MNSCYILLTKLKKDNKEAGFPGCFLEPLFWKIKEIHRKRAVVEACKFSGKVIVVINSSL